MQIYLLLTAKERLKNNLISGLMNDSIKKTDFKIVIF